ncbi:TPA: FAD-dependent monooxygenase [Legionella pneumophila]|nr:FAD-dependent monooxygenase [Legionella pneumophila]
MKNIPVLIIGGGPVGLSLALALARQNIRSLVIERHPSTTNHPKARGVNVRTMELFRQWGNSEELLKHEQPKEARQFIWAQSLQGEEVTRVTMEDFGNHSFSPAQASFVSQDHVEESLLHALANYEETEVRFLNDFISFEEDDTGITARILNKTNNKEEVIRAKFLIAADGTHSKIRKKLEITMDGSENLGQFCSVYCDIDISEWTKHRPCIGFLFTDIKLSGRFLASVDGANRWIVGLRFSEKNSKEDFTDEYCINLIREIVDLPNLTVNIINKKFWTMAAQIANQYQKGKVFLVGDAAHILPPTGGFGMNTGIQDAHNLAWKLAFVINYTISEKLLSTYYDERAPIAAQNIKWSTENAKRYTEIYAAIYSGDLKKLKIKLHEQQKNLNYAGLDLGFIYHSIAIKSENTETLSVTPTKYVPTTSPGSRAPHMKLIKNDKEISTLDLFEKHFVLLIGSEGDSWQVAAQELSQTLPFTLMVYKISADGDLIDPDNVWHDTYCVTKSGAVMIRPDGHVAWRSISMASNPKIELESCLKTILFL